MEFQGSSCGAVRRHSVRNQIFSSRGLVRTGIIVSRSISPARGYSTGGTYKQDGVIESIGLIRFPIGLKIVARYKYDLY